MSDIPTIEPEQIVAGDTVTWKRPAGDCINASGDQCKASEGYTLTYSLVKAAVRIAITAAAAGDDHLVSLAAATTATYTAGTYDWQAYVTHSGGARYMVGWGRIEILPNFAVEAAGYDSRSHVQIVLDALEAKIENRASSDQDAIVVGGQAIAKIPMSRLIEWYEKYKGYYADEIRADRIKKGLGHDGNIFVRFVDE